MKKANTIFISILVLYTVLMLILLFGCKAPRHIVDVVRDSTVIKYNYKDTLITLPGDTVLISTSIPCPEVKWKAQAKSNRAVLTATLENGKLNIDCAQDSLQLRILLLEKELQRKTNTIVHVPAPYEVIRYRVPWWAKITLAICLLLLTIFCIRNWRLMIAGAKAIVRFFI